MRGDAEALAARFLDGELSREEEREALHRIADDDTARSLLRFDAGLRGLVLEGRRAAVPEGFTDRVMAAIEARRPAAAEVGPTRLARLWEELGRPRTLRWRPAHALLAAAAVVLLITGAFLFGIVPASPDSLVVPRADRATGSEEDGPLAAGERAAEGARAAGADTVLVRFVFEDPAAGAVAVAGDFSRWEAVPLSRQWRDGEPIWSAIVAVPRGEHRYMFVVDGSRWVTDPLAATVRDDGFGNRNAILSL